MPAAIYIGSQFSLEGVAWAIYAVILILFIPAWWFLIRKMIGVDLGTYLSWVMPKLDSYQLISSQLKPKSKLAG